MQNPKTDHYYFEHALTELDILNDYVNEVDDYHEFASNRTIQDAIFFRFIQLIEYVKNISDDFKDKHPEIEWGEIEGFRNGIVHAYIYTKLDYVYDTMKNDLIPLKELLEAQLK